MSPAFSDIAAKQRCMSVWATWRLDVLAWLCPHALHFSRPYKEPIVGSCCKVYWNVRASFFSPLQLRAIGEVYSKRISASGTYGFCKCSVASIPTFSKCRCGNEAKRVDSFAPCASFSRAYSICYQHPNDWFPIVPQARDFLIRRIVRNARIRLIGCATLSYIARTI